MKKLMTLLFALMLTTSMTFAQTSGKTGASDLNNTVNQGAQVDQIGDDNVGHIDQVRSGSGTLGAEIFQQGDDNLGKIKQATNAVNMQSMIDQRGNDNRATTDLSSTIANFPVSSKDTKTLQYQEGNGNKASIAATGIIQDLIVKQVQVGSNNISRFTGSANAQAYQEQYGNNNIARALNVEKASRVEQYQEGDRNIATYEGTGHSTVGRSYQDQQGDDNVSRVRDFGSRGSARSLAETYQLGNDNTALIDFMGNVENEGLIDQNGDSNFGHIEFLSGGNNAAITQTGNDNVSTITQQ